MPLDPDIDRVLQLLAGLGGKPLHESTPQQARAGLEFATVGLRQVDLLPVVASVEDRVTSDGTAVRIYRPERDGPIPTIAYFHGGGFVVGSIDTHDDQARLLCRDVGAVVVSVDYRLAPEHPFPAGVDDCLAATRWIAAHVDELGGDASRLVVAGDSAGGNFAASVALSLRGTDVQLRAQLLIYPSIDFDEDGSYPSRFANAEGYFLTAADMLWFARAVMPPGSDPHDPRASVIRAASLAGLPPAVVATAEFDPLRDEGVAYAAALQAADVPVSATTYAGMIHGFFGFGSLSPGAAAASADICARLSRLLG